MRAHCLHALGLKPAALSDEYVPENLGSGDSMAWSYAARLVGKSGNDWHAAMAYCARVEERLAA